MSEYQYVEFMAIDGPVSKANLAFMRKQSTRAEISPWRFVNEYHYGQFRGDALEMLRRGYDAHLHYANFGIRRLMFRLPHGLPCDDEVFAAYEVPDCLTWQPDRQGGGILTIEPEADAGTFDYLMEVESMLGRLAQLREMLMAGDLRPLLIAWLACCYDEEAAVPPIPAGLGKLSAPLAALADFYEVPDELLREASREAPPAPLEQDQHAAVKKWVARQGKNYLQELVRQFLSDDAAGLRQKVLAEIRGAQDTPAWPTTVSARTYGELCGAAGL